MVCVAEVSMTQLDAPVRPSPVTPVPLDYTSAPKRSPFRLPGWAKFVALLGVVVFLLGAVLLPNLCAPRETANRVKCAANLKQIGNALQLFAKENAGRYPDQLSELVAAEELSPSMFICPSGTAEASVAQTPPLLAADLKSPNHSSYIYLKDNLGKADKAMVYESIADHDKDGMNVLFGDFHTEWVNQLGKSATPQSDYGIPAESPVANP